MIWRAGVTKMTFCVTIHVCLLFFLILYFVTSLRIDRTSFIILLKNPISVYPLFLFFCIAIAPFVFYHMFKLFDYISYLLSGINTSAGCM